MPRRNYSITLTDDDETLFREAMRAEGMESLGPWLKRAARLHAKNILRHDTANPVTLKRLVREVVQELRQGEQ